MRINDYILMLDMCAWFMSFRKIVHAQI